MLEPNGRNYPLPITKREERLIQLYAHSEFYMTPEQFYAKWDVTKAAIALITRRSASSVYAWFSQGRRHREASLGDLLHLALMDFALEYYEEMPEKLREIIFSSD